ncbi:G protein-coupled glucose receptor regulating Gpa2-domain-containing protein, partial [Truncatella angustata]
NQFLLLVYNLLFAEMQQSMAFLLNVSWASSNGVFVGTSTCWAQGWFISTGDLAASCFITAIAIHTYLTVVRGYQPPQWLLYLTIGGLWFFIYALAIVGVVLTNNGRDAGGLYVRAVAWCWMNVRYENLRLWLHYIWIFVSLALTSGLYILIFFSLRRQDNPIRFSRDGRAVTAIASGAESEQVAGTHPGFLIYPVIYGFCTAPLALFRVATMSGREVSVELFCFAGSMIASNGWLDVVLFSWTRSSIIFAPSPGSADTGLSTFAFMRTPPTRRYGNMIWVQGGSRADRDTGERRQNRGGWWKIGSDREHQTSRGGGSQRWPGALSSVSQESLRGAGINEIQMDTVTSVIVEVDPSNKEPALSVGSLDKEASES